MGHIITIGRQYGSGGTEVGRMLAEMMGVPFYDKEGLRAYAVENGLGKVLLESYGEKHASSLLFALSTSAYSFGYYDAAQDSTISQKAYLTAFETIREIAKKGSCVFVGRCADYVLRGREDCLHVFVHASLQKRVESVALRQDLSLAKAEELVLEQDRLRRNYYNYYTTKNWGDVDSYNLTVDSGAIGTEQTAQLLCQIAGLGNGSWSAGEPVYSEQAR